MPSDRLRDAFHRVHDVMENTTIDVFEPSESFTQGDGWTVTYPDTADASYSARVEEPDADNDRERSGTTSEIDAVVRVRDDTGQQWTGFGDETEASIRVRDTADSRLYEVQSVVDTHNGWLKLAAVEV